MIKIQVSKAMQGKIRKGYPWVFHYQIVNLEDVTGAPGDLGVVYDSNNKFLAIGLYDPFSDIRLRVLMTGKPVRIDAAFFRNRLLDAVVVRKSLEGQGTTGYRVLNGENDGFPGLILDRYGDTVVLKLYSLAWASHLDLILPLILEVLPVKRCVLRLSRDLQKSEHSRLKDGVILSGPPLGEPVVFRENELLFEVDVLHGHKTGFFLDQRENRNHVRKYSLNRKVLNVFSYSGAFSVYAFAGGCRSVMEIDSNPHALKTSCEILKKNFLDKIFSPPNFIQTLGDAFESLDALKKNGERFDLIILDPPAFASNKSQHDKALHAYARLARAGSELITAGGIIFAASCSAHVGADEFYNAVLSGTNAAGKKAKEILRTGHATDHPVTFEMGAYLKGIFLEAPR